ncbi:hypothetical protein AB0I60_07985 [Actinosynnema sp. NPDC050436]|uniref:hypothetical protein n=1 Tax=Actinosynnema sp. NPDC050436 TaxID=3155659 RepID=UPI003405A57A
MPGTSLSTSGAPSFPTGTGQPLAQHADIARPCRISPVPVEVGDVPSPTRRTARPPPGARGCPDRRTVRRGVVLY